MRDKSCNVPTICLLNPNASDSIAFVAFPRGQLLLLNDTKGSKYFMIVLTSMWKHIQVCVDNQCPFSISNWSTLMWGGFGSETAYGRNLSKYFLDRSSSSWISFLLTLQRCLKQVNVPSASQKHPLSPLCYRCSAAHRLCQKREPATCIEQNECFLTQNRWLQRNIFLGFEFSLCKPGNSRRSINSSLLKECHEQCHKHTIYHRQEKLFWSWNQLNTLPAVSRSDLSPFNCWVNSLLPVRLTIIATPSAILERFELLLSRIRRFPQGNVFLMSSSPASPWKAQIFSISP